MTNLEEKVPHQSTGDVHWWLDAITNIHADDDDGKEATENGAQDEPTKRDLILPVRDRFGGACGHVRFRGVVPLDDCRGRLRRKCLSSIHADINSEQPEYITHTQ